MKKILLALLSVLALSVHACWLPVNGYTYSEISGVNYFQPHVNRNGQEVTVSNNVYISLPLTVWCKIMSTTNSALQNNEINLAILYYRVQRGNARSNWYIAKEITNARWKIDFKNQVKLFGRNVLTLSQIKKDTGYTLRKNDKIILYVYFRTASGNTSGTYIINGSNIPDIYYNNGWVIPTGFVYSEYCIMQVIYNGQINNTGR